MTITVAFDLLQVQAAGHAADVQLVPRSADPGQGQGDGHARGVRHSVRQGERTGGCVHTPIIIIIIVSVFLERLSM